MIAITNVILILNSIQQYVNKTIGFNCNTICFITMGINICGILNGIKSVIYILIKILILVSVLVALAIVFDENNSNLDKIDESECDCDSNSNVSRRNQMIFLRMIFATDYDNLFKVSLFTSFLVALRIIFNVIGSSFVKIYEFKCGYDSNVNVTMILNNFGQSRIEIEILCVVIYNIGK